MTRRKTLSDKGVADLKPRDARYTKPDPELAGHYIRVQPSGAKSYVAVARDPNGRQVWHTIGSTSLIKIEDARDKARDAIKAIRAGADRAGPQSVKVVSEMWFKRHVEKKGRELRTKKELRRYLDKWILPAWGGRDFESVRRVDVANLLDKIEDNAGPVSADKALAVISNICNWYAARHDKYQSPVVKGMRRSNPQERARERILTDEEIRTVWRQAEANGTFGAFVRILLLTGQRLQKVQAMRWEDVSVDGTWSIPAEEREKGNAGVLMLPDIALDIIRARPRFGSNPYVFAGRGDSYSKGLTKRKAAFDEKAPVQHWTLHDLRRTARSLMSRAGVRPDIAERALGHAIRGVEGIYDRHSYREEKAHALKALAGLLDKVVNPTADNVVAMSSSVRV